jgi:hypothetical protein
MFCTLSTILHRLTQRHLCWHSITKILRKWPKDTFPFQDASARAERSSPLSSCGSEDKTIQERGRHLHGIRRLVQPPGGIETAWPAARDATGAADLRTARPSPVRWTDSHTPLDGGRQRWKRHQSHPGQGARHAAADGAYSRPTPRSRGSPPLQGW